ncbi:MAG TPA: hypothetical protein VGA26_04150 [Candidatus Limnocylindria bacterium]
MFGGGRRRRAAAAEAAHEALRRALFAQLAQRPAHICPFLGLAYERTGYVDGPSIEHRCFAFGDPAPLSTEQQTRVCQEKGYGQCPRYLRGLLVTPTEELQALRNPQAAMAALPPLPSLPSQRPAPVPVPPQRRRRRILLAGLLVLLLLVVLGGAGAAYLFLRGDGVAFGPTGTPEPSATAAPPSAATVAPTPTTTTAPSGTQLPSPTPEPTPSAGDTFAFYEVSVGPGSNLLFEIDDDGNVGDQRRAMFDDFSFARVVPIEGTDGEVYWRTEDGGLAGLAYRYPESNDFRIRAVFIDDDGSRRSIYLAEDDLTRFPEATPAP